MVTDMEHKQMKIALLGFVIALIGVLTGFLGSEFQVRGVMIAAFVVTCLGVGVGMVGVFRHWLPGRRSDRKKPRTDK